MIVCRCLVLADGFYEWQRLGRREQPFYIRLRDGRPFGLPACGSIGMIPMALAADLETVC